MQLGFRRQPLRGGSVFVQHVSSHERTRRSPPGIRASARELFRKEDSLVVRHPADLLPRTKSPADEFGLPQQFSGLSVADKEIRLPIDKADVAKLGTQGVEE